MYSTSKCMESGTTINRGNENSSFFFADRFPVQHQQEFLFTWQSMIRRELWARNLDPIFLHLQDLHFIHFWNQSLVSDEFKERIWRVIMKRRRYQSIWSEQENHRNTIDCQDRWKIVHERIQGSSQEFIICSRFQEFFMLDQIMILIQMLFQVNISFCRW